MIALSVAGTGSWWYTCGFGGCPTVAQLRAWRPSEGGVLLARDSGVVSALSLVRRVNVPLTRVPAHVQRAFVAVEDRRFRDHHGVDWYGVARALVHNVRAGGVREGASTITMQLARNVFLGSRAAERSWGRKLLEWRYAQLLEGALTKEQILEGYLNAIYLGNGVYGIEAASRDLFGKGVASLTLADAALLAGLPKAPSSYSPRKSRERALARRAIVLDVLGREGVADPLALHTSRTAPLMLAPREFVPARLVDSWALEAVRVTLDSLRQAGVIPPALADAHLRVWSTIDRRAQIAAERAVAAQAVQIDEEREWSSQPVRGDNRTQGALVALDPATGAMRAVVGGRRVERKGFNRALRSRRQPGSTFKPFVYAAALQQGFTPASMVEDEPVEIGTGRRIWRPANYGDDYAGRITLRDALARSANAATVRLSREVGVPRIAALAAAQGIVSALPRVPALALGAAAVTPLELTAAYAPFANGGVRVHPHIVLRVEDQFGELLWAAPTPAGTRVLEAVDAFLVTSLLQGAVDEGTGRAVRASGIRGPVAGKTGTTNAGADVWFVGYTPTLVAGVWFGTDTPQPLGWNASGGRLAAPAWARFLRNGWHSPEQDAPWQPPPGIEAQRIDIATGTLASDWCGPSRREYFRTGTAPTASCEDEGFSTRRDTEPPDWHDRDGDAEHLNAALQALLEVTTQRGKAREIADRVLQEMKRAARNVRGRDERYRRCTARARRRELDGASYRARAIGRERQGASYRARAIGRERQGAS
ncbi:MAG: penicillin-binding protein 1A [Gemmatimonadaceae bacterium]